MAISLGSRFVFANEESESRIFSWSGRFAFDYNANVKKPKDFGLTNGAALRSADLSFGVDFQNSISLNLDLEFSPSGVSIGTAFIKFEDLFYNTDLLLGQVPTPFCQEQGNSSKYITEFERSLISAFKACIGPGFYLNHHQDAWAVQFALRAPPFGYSLKDANDKKHAYHDNFNDHMGGALRVSGAPIMNDDMLIHVGASGSYQAMAKGKAGQENMTRFKATEVKGRNSSLMEISETFDAKSFLVVGAELSPVYGPFQLESEALFNFVSPRLSGSKADMIYGVKTGFNWIMTGQQRTYSVAHGTFGKISRKDVGAFGVWQTGIRYSHLNLTKHGGDIKKAHNITGALNWYPTAELRLGANYVHSMQTLAAEKRDFGTFALRMQLVF